MNFNGTTILFHELNVIIPSSLVEYTMVVSFGGVRDGGVYTSENKDSTHLSTNVLSQVLERHARLENVRLAILPVYEQ